MPDTWWVVEGETCGKCGSHIMTNAKVRECLGDDCDWYRIL